MKTDLGTSRSQAGQANNGKMRSRLMENKHISDDVGHINKRTEAISALL